MSANKVCFKFNSSQADFISFIKEISLESTVYFNCFLFDARKCQNFLKHLLNIPSNLESFEAKRC